MNTSVERKAPDLHWWVVFAAAVALAAPFFLPWAFFIQVAAIGFAVFALFRVKSGSARAIVIVALVLVCIPIAVQVVTTIAAVSLNGTFGDTAVPVG